MKKIRDKDSGTFDLFSHQESRTKDTSPADNVVCFRKAESRLRAAKESNISKEALDIILERAKKLGW